MLTLSARIEAPTGAPSSTDLAAVLSIEPAEVSQVFFAGAGVPFCFAQLSSNEAAFDLGQRFEMHYTPKKGSWLNMAELELSALSRICLSRRVPSIEELDREIQAIVKERNELGIKVEWQFSITKARKKLSRHYENVQSKD
jgi:hypothetical protein